MARPFPGDPPGLIDEASATLRRLRRRLRERRCRLVARPTVLDEDRLAVRMLEGPEILVDRHDRGLSQSLADGGYWEMWLTEAIEAAVRPGMIAIDIGANVGYFSLLMAERVGPAGRVHAFEPNPHMAGLIAESAARAGWDDRIAIHPEPLWDTDGEASVLKVPAGEPKNAHLVTQAGDDVVGVRLATRRLDGFVDLLDADVIKIDVEGAEERVWRGMAGLLARRRALTIFLEYSPVRYEAPMTFLEQMLAEGFVLGELSVSHGIRAVTPEQVLAGRADEDRMLALVRGRCA